MKKGKKCEKLSRLFVGMKNFTHASRRKIDGKIVAFLSSVVYFFEDLLKSGNRALVQKKTFIILYSTTLGTGPKVCVGVVTEL